MLTKLIVRGEKMYKYSYQVRLEYEYIEEGNYPRNITYDYEDIEYSDIGAKICLKMGFDLNVSEVIADNRDNAFFYACNVIRKVCKVVTILLQIQNYDHRESCPHITFLPYKVKMLCEESLDETMLTEKDGENKIKEHLGIHDCIAGIQKTEILDLSSFTKLYCNCDNNNFIDIGDVIYRAVLAQNAESRFFQLFTIIEAIETKYGLDEEISHKMIQSDKVESVKESLQPLLKSLAKDSDYRSRLNSRFIQIITTATIESRSEKLSNIIIKKYNVLEVKKGVMKYSINSNKMKEFIDLRNKLFHGKQIEPEEYGDLIQKTNELQELCLLLLDC